MLAGLLAAVVLPACGTSLPGPPMAPNVTANYVEVPYPPPPARIEYIPKRPNETALWVDGGWRYRGRRWRWVPGSWFDVPAGARFAHWASTIRADGVFLYAPGEWMDAKGKALPAPKIVARGVSNVLAIDEDPGLKDEPVVHGPDVPPNLKAGIGSGGGAAPAGTSSTSQQSTSVGGAK
jgi:hypothetical protein